MLSYRVFITESISILKTDIPWASNGIIFPVHCLICRFKMLIVSRFSLLILKFRDSMIEGERIVIIHVKRFKLIN